MVTILQNMFTFIAQIVKTLNAKPQIRHFHEEHNHSLKFWLVFGLSQKISNHLRIATLASWRSEFSNIKQEDIASKRRSIGFQQSENDKFKLIPGRQRYSCTTKLLESGTEMQFIYNLGEIKASHNRNLWLLKQEKHTTNKITL